jgi:hypothetical protein
VVAHYQISMKNTTDLSTQEKKARVTSPRIKMNSNSKSKRLNHESDTEAIAVGRSERACGARKMSRMDSAHELKQSSKA